VVCVQQSPGRIDRRSRIAYNGVVTASPLDSRAAYERLDRSGLYKRIIGLPDQFEEAWAAARSLPLPSDFRGAERIVVAGMGGSGVGGTLARALSIDLGATTPVDLVRGYTLPGWVDERCLVLALSNSGDTEETVAAFRDALATGARCVAVTTGGKLLGLAQKHDAPALAFEWDGEPRSAVGWSFASVLAIGSVLGLLPDVDADVTTAAGRMRELLRGIERDAPEEGNPAKQLARWLEGSLPVIIGAESLAAVAYRWRTQINENAKSWAIAEELPEQSHNAPVGYALPRDLTPMLRVVLLRHAAMGARNAMRLAATQEQLADAGIAVRTLDVAGPTRLAQMLWALQFGDMTSYYLGILHGVDPSEVRALEWLKARMTSSP
jgi:glucose/mannose-6-phosphate isomerase